MVQEALRYSDVFKRQVIEEPGRESLARVTPAENQALKARPSFFHPNPHFSPTDYCGRGLHPA